MIQFWGTLKRNSETKRGVLYIWRLGEMPLRALIGSCCFKGHLLPYPYKLGKCPERMHRGSFRGRRHLPLYPLFLLACRWTDRQTRANSTSHLWPKSAKKEPEIGVGRGIATPKPINASYLEMPRVRLVNFFLLFTDEAWLSSHCSSHRWH